MDPQPGHPNHKTPGQIFGPSSFTNCTLNSRQPLPYWAATEGPSISNRSENTTV